jgi:hypothetical protein
MQNKKNRREERILENLMQFFATFDTQALQLKEPCKEMQKKMTVPKFYKVMIIYDSAALVDLGRSFSFLIHTQSV